MRTQAEHHLLNGRNLCYGFRVICSGYPSHSVIRSVNGGGPNVRLPWDAAKPRAVRKVEARPPARRSAESSHQPCRRVARHGSKATGSPTPNSIRGAVMSETATSARHPAEGRRATSSRRPRSSAPKPASFRARSLGCSRPDLAHPGAAHAPFLRRAAAGQGPKARQGSGERRGVHRGSNSLSIGVHPTPGLSVGFQFRDPLIGKIVVVGVKKDCDQLMKPVSRLQCQRPARILLRDLRHIDDPACSA